MVHWYTIYLKCTVRISHSPIFFLHKALYPVHGTLLGKLFCCLQRDPSIPDCSLFEFYHLFLSQIIGHTRHQLKIGDYTTFNISSKSHCKIVDQPIWLILVHLSHFFIKMYIDINECETGKQMPIRR